MGAEASTADAVLKGFGAGVSIFAGYLFLRVNPFRRYKAEHLRTDRFALHVFGFALISYTISVIVASVIDRKFPGTWFQINLHKVSDSYAHVEAPVLITLFVAPLIGAADSLFIFFLMRHDPAVVPHSWNKPITKIRAAARTRFVLQCDDPTTRLLHRASVYRKPIILTLKSGKVYVGQPDGSIGDPSVRAQSIKIIPLLSGFRNSETQKVELPTKYVDVYQKMVPRKIKEPKRPEDPLAKDLADLTCADGSTFVTDMQDLGVVVLWSEVLSMSLYDENIYRAFQDAVLAETVEWRWFGKDGVLTKMLSAID